MTHDVSQWLTEIKTLRQQLADAQQDCERSYASAANWQRLYETEAQQRRTETNQANQAIAALRQEIQQLKGTLPLDSGTTTEPMALRTEVEKLQTVAVLQEKLIEVLADRDCLMQALNAEQTSHAQTRKGLTTALGDAIDMLSKKEG